jgi:lipopolysaccharide transport system ATP-binding protein
MQSLKKGGRTILFVSHHSHQVRSLCDRVVYLKHGKKVFDGDTTLGVQRYQTESLAEHAQAGADAAKDAPLRIESAAVRRDGDEAFASGGSLDVVVRYRVTGALAAPPVLSVSLVRADGVTACVLNSRERDVALDAAPGEHAVVARFDALPLHAGRHHVEVLLWDASMVTVLAQSAAGAIDVEVPAAALVNRPGVFWPQGSIRKGGA